MGALADTCIIQQNSTIKHSLLTPTKIYTQGNSTVANTAVLPCCTIFPFSYDGRREEEERERERERERQAVRVKGRDERKATMELQVCVLVKERTNTCLVTVEVREREPVCLISSSSSSPVLAGSLVMSLSLAGLRFEP